MNRNIFLEDIKEAVLTEIWQRVKRELSAEIEEAARRGIDRETAEFEIVDDYLNQRNFGINLEL